MPKYQYKCLNCGFIFEQYHSMDEVLEHCPDCESTYSLKRIPGEVFIKLMREEKNNFKPGQITEKFIEEAKQDLQEQKKELKGKEYK